MQKPVSIAKFTVDKTGWFPGGFKSGFKIVMYALLPKLPEVILILGFNFAGLKFGFLHNAICRL
jgi:hypothetical protein